MNTRIYLATVCVLLTASCVAYCGFVDLSPDEKGDRIAVVKDGKVAYLPATRVYIGSNVVGGGACRYIKRSRSGDLYVAGPWLKRLFCSKDGGHSWTSSPLDIGKDGFMSAFTILRDDTFLVLLMPSNYTGNKQCYVARSEDYGQNWTVSEMGADLRPYKYMNGGNADLLELSDGTVLLPLDLGMGPDNIDDEQGRELPVQQKGVFVYAFRSQDGGKTWTEKSLVTQHAGETHLLQLPSGKVLACMRKQRWHRMPGDPSSVLEIKKRHGYRPGIVGGGEIADGEDANRIKNMFVSESYDGGYIWVNEQQVCQFMQCSGDMSYLTDGTLVLQYLHRYDRGPAAGIGIRARVSYDEGKTWEPEEYILSDGENYPGGIAMPSGGMISMCPHKGRIQAVHWRPLPKNKPALTYQTVPTRPAAPSAPSFDSGARIEVIADGKTTHRPATHSAILPVALGSKHSEIRYQRNGSIVQSSPSGTIYCAGNILGQYMMVSKDEGRTWQRRNFAIQGWGEMVGFRILRKGDFLIVYEPAGRGHRGLYTARSKDEGKTWSVTMANLDLSPFTRVSGKDNSVIELLDARLVMAVQLWGGRDESGAEAPRGEQEGLAYTLRSTDGGATWSERASICGLAGKSRLVSLQSGKLLACVQSIKPGPYNKFFIAESMDGGVTWTNPREAIAGLQPSTASLTQLADGRVVLQFVYDKQPGKSQYWSGYAGCGMRAVVSHDEGKTWQKEVFVLSRVYEQGAQPTGFGAYLGDTVQLADGRLLTTCTGTVDSKKTFSATIWKP